MKNLEFHELGLGQSSMDEFLSKFIFLLRYVTYLKEEKAKIKIFISFLPISYRDIIDFDNPRTIEKTTRKAKLCFAQNQKGDNSKSRMTKKHERFNTKKKGFKRSVFPNTSKIKVEIIAEV